MKSFLLVSVLSFAVTGVLAASAVPQEVVAERSRITAERAQAEARFAAEEKTCYQKFAVNDCLGEARARRRAVLASLRRQETSLNDAERRRKGAERLREQEERTSPEAQQADSDRRAQAVAERLQREARSAQKAAGTARPSKPGVKTAPRKNRQIPAAQAAENARHHEQKVEEVRQRKARVEQRHAQRHKAPAKPLPVPP